MRITGKHISSLIVVLLLAAVAGYYWWYEYAARLDLQMKVIGFQGTVSVNGTTLTEETTRFNAHEAHIEVGPDSVFNGQLEDGSYLQVVEDSKLNIDNARRNKNGFKIRTRFKLDAGQVIRDIPKVEKITDYSSSLITDSVNIGIRGTQYAAIAEDRLTRSMLYRGTVELDSKGIDQVMLSPNTGTVTEQGKASEPPSELPAPPDNIYSFSPERAIARDWGINWNRVVNAQSYLVEIARDEAFRNLVSRKHANGAQLLVSDLPYDAHFYWRVSSVDGRKLRGLPSDSRRVQYKYHHEQIKQLETRMDGADELIAKALRGYPNDIELLKDIGKYYYRIGEYQKAIAYYNRALEIEPDNDALLLERGRAFQAIGQRDKAEEDFNKTISIESMSAEAYWSRGTVEAEKDLHEHAMEDFFRAISIQPDHPRANLSAAAEWFKRGETAKARKHLEMHLEYHPDDQTALNQLSGLPELTPNAPAIPAAPTRVQ